MSQIVGHVRKIKTSSGLGNVVAHNERRKIYDENGQVLHNSQTQAAYYEPKNAGFNHIDELENPYARRDEIIRKAKEENEKAGLEWRKPMKNAAAAVEITLSFSPDWAPDWRGDPAQKARVDEFMKRSRAFLEKKYPGSLLHLAEHFDEKTPHLHAVLVPITKNQRKKTDEKAGWRYSSGDFFGGREGLRQFQTDIYEAVKDLGLERGNLDSRAKHKTLKDHDEELRQLPERVKELDRQEKELEKREKKIAKQEENLTDREKRVTEKEEGLDRREQEMKSREWLRDKFQESKKRQLEGWEFPEPGLMESAKKYRDRIEPEVSGVVAKALETVEKYDKKLIRETDKLRTRLREEEQKAYQAGHDRDQYKEAYEHYRTGFEGLSKRILDTRTVEDVNQLKTELLPIKGVQKGMSHG